MQTGQARYEFKILSYTSVAADRVGYAMTCAVQQSGAAFWEFYDHFLVERSSASRREALISFATEVGLDKDSFTLCYDDPATRQQVSDDLNAARALGITYGPRVRVNGVNAGTSFQGIKREVDAANQ